MSLRRAVTWPIRLYQRFLSPLKPPTCRFHPTCSAYAVEAILVHGVVRGSGLATWRILRCQPFSAGGFDPVPPARAPRVDPVPASVNQQAGAAASEGESAGDGC